MSKLKQISGILLAVVIFLGTLFGFLGFLNKIENKKAAAGPGESKKIVINPGDMSRIPNWREISDFPPLSETRYLMTLSGETIFDVRYKIDENMLRLEQRNPSAKSHLIIGGCSFVFGNALPADETLTSLLNQKQKNYNVVNMGFGAGGLQNQLRYFELKKMDFIKQKDGNYIYVYINDHPSRWLANPTYMNWASGEKIHYEVKNDQLHLMGKLKDQKFFKQFELTKRAGLNNVVVRAKAVPRLFEWKTEELRNFMTGIKYLREAYNKQFPKGRFIFMIHPISGALPEEQEKLQMLAAEMGIEFENFSRQYSDHIRLNGLQNEMKVPYDGHPNKKFNGWFADQMIKNLL